MRIHHFEIMKQQSVININQQAMSMRCSVEGLQLAAICAEVRLDEAGSGTACAAVRSSNASVLRVTAAEAHRASSKTAAACSGRTSRLPCRGKNSLSCGTLHCLHRAHTTTAFCQIQSSSGGQGSEASPAVLWIRINKQQLQQRCRVQRPSHTQEPWPQPMLSCSR